MTSRRHKPECTVTCPHCGAVSAGARASSAAAALVEHVRRAHGLHLAYIDARVRVHDQEKPVFNDIAERSWDNEKEALFA